MNAKLTFKTVKTTYGQLFTMKISGGSTKLTEDTDYFLYKSRPQGLAWVGPAYLAENKTAWRIGRLADKSLVAWKTTKISARFGQENYRMRSVQGGYKGDFVKSWSRCFNGKTRSFSKILWNGGKDGWTVRVYEGQSTVVLHEWNGKG